MTFACNVVSDVDDGGVGFVGRVVVGWLDVDEVAVAVTMFTELVFVENDDADDEDAVVAMTMLPPTSGDVCEM